MYEVLHVEPLDSTYHYVKITDAHVGTSADVWVPASGKGIHVTGGNISVTGAGVVEIRDKTAAATIAILDFGEKKALPFNAGTDVVLPKDHVIEVKWTIDAATGDCHITLFGHEH